jgi:hypothetical protein
LRAAHGRVTTDGGRLDDLRGDVPGLSLLKDCRRVNTSVKNYN